MIQRNNTTTARLTHIQSSLVGVGVVLVIIILQAIAKITQSILSSWGVPSQIAAWIALAGPEVIAMGLLLIGLRHNDWHFKSLIGTTQLHWWEYTLLPIGILIGATLSAYIVDFGLAAILSILHIHVPGPTTFAALLAPRSGYGYFIVAVGVAIPAFVEEFIFRAYLPLAFSRFLPVWLAVALSMALFGLIHYVGLGVVNAVGLMFWALIPTVYVWRSRKLFPAMIAHYISDFLTFAVVIPLTFHFH